MSFDKIQVQGAQAIIDLSRDPWLAEYVESDDSRPEWLIVTGISVSFPVRRASEVAYLLDAHEENCLMQQSPSSAKFIASVASSVREIAAAS
jgi:hypothetical protein